jgi:3-phenylpropionate/trans-cinnamate dioxygenase ferredoxin reductase subunit
MHESVVIIGAGLAGLSVVRALRSRGFSGKLTVIGDEPIAPYDRPPLSKAFITGPSEPPMLCDAKDLESMDLRLATKVLGLSDNEVHLSNGERIRFDACVICTGLRARLPKAFSQAPSVFVLRTLADATALKQRLASADDVLVVGGGFIATELADSAATLGKRVTMVFPEPTPLYAPLGPSLGLAVGEWLLDRGVRMVSGSKVLHAESGPNGRAVVTLENGSILEADVLALGLGSMPNVEWLEGSGVQVDDGVLVNENLRAPGFENVFAAGDVAHVKGGQYGDFRFEHWDNAIRMADVVAANVLGGNEVYKPLPYFWTEVAGRMIQVYGDPEAGATAVTRGAPYSDSGSIFHVESDRLRGSVHVNAARDGAAAKRLIAAGALVDEDALQNPAVPVAKALKGTPQKTAS